MRLAIASIAAGVLGVFLQCAVAQVSAQQTKPNFDVGEQYKSVRAKMLALGWAPFTAPNARACRKGDLRCKDRPETAICADREEANCKFLWQKGSTTIGICTVGKGEPTFANTCDTSVPADKPKSSSKFQQMNTKQSSEIVFVIRTRIVKNLEELPSRKRNCSSMVEIWVSQLAAADQDWQRRAKRFLVAKQEVPAEIWEDTYSNYSTIDNVIAAHGCN
jgi:hypothetical protein